jgi:hypothetical protein
LLLGARCPPDNRQVQRISLSFLLVFLSHMVGHLPDSAVFGQSAGYPHAYFDELSARPEKRHSFSLRAQSQLDEFVHGRLPSDHVTYDPAGDRYPTAQDAAKVMLRQDSASLAKQVWFPIAIDSGTALITWDAWWGLEYQSQAMRGGLDTHKTFQIASPIDKSERWLEIRTRYALGTGVGIGGADARPYADLGPNSREGSGGRIEPMRTEFIIAPQTWTRYWVQIELRPTDWDRVSWWMADENRTPVQLLDRVEMKSAGTLTKFWLEYNSSQTRIGGPLVAYVRNLVVLHNLRDPRSVLSKPLGSGRPSNPTVRPPQRLRIIGGFHP